MQIGDILVFKRSGILACILANILWLFDLIFLKRNWDKWGWHTAMVVDIQDDKVWIIESVNPVSRKRLLGKEQYRVYHWLNPDLIGFIVVWNSYLNKKYDFDSYLSTFLTYPLTHLLHKPLRFVDDEYHCQELICAICEDMGKPVIAKWKPVVITEIIAALKS
jgi:hypothetical protein